MKTTVSKKKQDVSFTSKIGDKLSLIIAMVSFCFILWFIISFIDVNLHNLDPENSGPRLSWNFFTYFLSFVGY